MKGRNQNSFGARLAALGATATATEFELVDNKPPTEFRIFRAGVNTSDKGDFIFDDESAAMVMAAYAKKANTLTMDYEHQALADPPIEAPASCYSWKPEVRNGELWATDCKWTERAYGLIAAREYTRYSPAFFHDRKTMRVQKILNMALTNVEALDGIEPLMAASATTTTAGERPMAKKMQCKACLKALKAPTDEDDGDEVMCTACSAPARLGAVVGLKATATEADLTTELASLSGLRTNVIALTGEKTLPAALGVIQAWKTKADGYDALATEKAAGELAALTARLNSELDKAATDGKVPPAGKDSLRAAVLKMGAGKVTSDGLEWLTAHVAALPKLVSTQETAQADGGAGAAVVKLTAAEIESADRHGLNKDVMLKAKQQRAARTAAAQQ